MMIFRSEAASWSPYCIFLMDDGRVLEVMFYKTQYRIRTGYLPLVINGNGRIAPSRPSQIRTIERDAAGSEESLHANPLSWYLALQF